MVWKIILTVLVVLPGVVVLLKRASLDAWERRLRRRGVLHNDTAGALFIAVPTKAVAALRRLASMEALSDGGEEGSVAIERMCDIVEEAVPDGDGFVRIPYGDFMRGVHAVTTAMGRYPNDKAARRAYDATGGGMYDAWIKEMDRLVSLYETKF